MDDVVSIIIPCYQAQNYIKQCVGSIINQTYKHLEAVFVDDGSTDNTLNELKRFTLSHENFHVIHQNNYGVSEARNNGIAHSSGKYITFLDVDDYIEPDFVMNLVNEAKDSKVSLISSKISGMEYDKSFTDDCSKEYNKKELNREFDYLYSNWFFHNVCGKLYIKEIAQTCFFPTDFRIGEDLIYNIQYLAKIKSVKIINYYGYVYNKCIDSAVHKYKKTDIEIQKELYSKSIEFYGRYFGEEYKGIAIKQVFTNNIIDIIRVCMTWENISVLKDAIYTINSDEEISNIIRTTSVNIFTRKIILFCIIYKFVLCLGIIGILNARRYK